MYSPCAEQSPLFRVPCGEQDRSSRALPFGGRSHERLGNLHHANRSGAIIVRAVEDALAVRTVMVVVRADDDYFIAKLRIRSFQQGDDVAVRDDLAID